MALRKPNSKFGPGPLVTLDSGDDLLVRDFVSLIATTASPVAANGSNHVATINGYISGITFGIVLGGSVSDDNGNRLVVGKTGVISAPLEGLVAGAIVVGRNASVLNDGKITGNFALVAGGDGGDATSVINNGQIIGNAGVVRASGSTDIIRLVNTGRIIAEASFVGTDALGVDINARDVVINRGVMTGDIRLSEGNDVYDGSKGGRVNGLIDGGNGSDVFRPGAAAEDFDGGSGNDILNFRKVGAVQVALDGAFASTGFAQGDSYLGIEQVWGSNTGDDRIRGSSGPETLKGFGGDDRLIGGDGFNFLVGGRGRDVLTGGADIDIFQFTSPADLGDRITNFDQAEDTIYLSSPQFRASPLQFGPAANEFRTRTDNKAQDGNDHYIFRTTDKTL
jgi:Ca2+-binding RTX toxin-like protein